MKNIRRGEIYYVDLGENIGSELNKVRPCVIIQNNVGNQHSPTTIVIPISHRKSSTLPTQVGLTRWMQEKDFKFLDGVIMAEQIRTVDKKRLQSLAGALLPNAMNLVDKAVCISIGVSYSGYH